MEICLIAPANLLGRYCQNSNIQMCLAHRVLEEDDDYVTFYERQSQDGQIVIMDNSLWELGEAMCLEDLMYAVSIIQPQELIIPDMFGKSDETIDMTEKFLDEIGSVRRWERNFVVPHGKDRQDWIKCFDYFSDQFYAHVIGLPKVLDDIWEPGGRIGCLSFLEATGRIRTDKIYHALGIRNDPIELLMLSKFKWLRSLDTALPIHAGIQGIQFDSQFGLSRRRPKRPEKYFDTEWRHVNQFESIIQVNVDLTLAWAKGEWNGHI